MRCGVRIESGFQCRSCPRNCRRRAHTTSHWGKPGKAVPGGDPRARRPTVDSSVCRAGCLGAGRVRTAVGIEFPDSTPPKAPGPKAYAFMSGRVTLTNIATTNSAADSERLAPAESAITIYVCITCRGGRPLDLVPVPGEMLAIATARAAEGTGIAVRPIRCLANCNCGLSAAVRRDGAWTYVFGYLDPSNGAGALIEGARLFANAPDGLMPWRGRPEALKRGLVARTPPFDFAGDF